MNVNRVLGLAAVVLLLGEAARPSSVAEAAARYVPEVNWQPASVVAADFTCRGRQEQAILGTNSSEIVIAVFLNGTSARPEILRYSAKVRRAATAVLAVEDREFDPKDVRSKTCKGLNLSDGEIDSAHIFWNHDARRFQDWVR